MTTCEICGKPQSPYPNWIVSKGHAMHVGCMADFLDEIKAAYAQLLDHAIASGNWGPFCDDWKGTFADKYWGEIDLWRKSNAK